MSFRFKLGGNLLQQGANLQVLGADCLAPAAADAVARFASVQGGAFVVGFAVPVLVDLLGVIAGKQCRNIDLLGAARRAVAAGGAGNAVLAVHDGAHLHNGGLLGLGQGLEILQKAVFSSIWAKSLMPDSTMMLRENPAAKRSA